MSEYKGDSIVVLDHWFMLEPLDFYTDDYYYYADYSSYCQVLKVIEYLKYFVNQSSFDFDTLFNSIKILDNIVGKTGDPITIIPMRYITTKLDFTY